VFISKQTGSKCGNQSHFVGEELAKRVYSFECESAQILTEKEISLSFCKILKDVQTKCKAKAWILCMYAAPLLTLIVSYSRTPIQQTRNEDPGIRRLTRLKLKPVSVA